MTEEKTKSRPTGRTASSTDEGYEISYFAWKRGVADEQLDQPIMKWASHQRN